MSEKQEVSGTQRGGLDREGGQAQTQTHRRTDSIPMGTCLFIAQALYPAAPQRCLLFEILKMCLVLVTVGLGWLV